MKYVDLRLRLPDGLLHPMQAFIRHGDAVEYEELLTWSVQPREGVEYGLYYVEADPEPYRAAVEDVDSIREYRIEPIDDRAMHVWACEEIRPENQAWRTAFAGRHLVVVPPVRIDDEAVMGMTIVGDGADVNDVLDELPPAVDVTVDAIGTYDRRGGTVAGALTDRQLEALGAALSVGYYEVPRQGSLADVAAALGCAESTASVLVRRAERDVFARMLDRYGGAVDQSTG